MFRHENKILPTIFSDFYIKNRDCTNRATRQCDQLHKINSKCPQLSRSIRITGITYYNHFHEIIPMNITYPTYKKCIKAYLIGNIVPKLHG